MKLAYLLPTVTLSLHSNRGAAWCTFSITAAKTLDNKNGGHIPSHQSHSSLLALPKTAATGRISLEQNNEELLHLGQSMLAGSDLIYAFASLRKAAINYLHHGMKLNQPELILPDLEKPMQFNFRDIVPTMKTKSALVVKSPRDGLSSIVTIPINRVLNQYLKQEVSAVDVYDFLINNREFCRNITEFDAEDMKNTLKPFFKLNLGVVAFEDEFQESELVFGITINRTQKRITVLFRGSVTKKDWKTNVNTFFTQLRINQTMFNKELHGKIKVHSGFNGYLNDAPDGRKKKNSELKELLQAWAREYNWPQWVPLVNPEDDALRMTKTDKVV